LNAPPVRWPEILAKLIAGDHLDEDTAAVAMGAVMEGEATPAQVAGFVTALRMKGETAAEITGLVRAMRSAALPVPLDEASAGPLVDTCGTGGDRAGTFNVSTLAAVVTAATGVRVAKHGNRAASGRCGSADLLEAWGIVIDLPPAGVARCIADVGIGFCFAPTFHPAMRHAMPARRELGVPTVFNFLGPLTNPAGVRHQTIGVSDPAMAPRMAAVLARLGAAHALVFHGADGLDELTTTGPSTVWEVRDGEVDEWRLDPVSLGLTRARVDDLRGGDVQRNRDIADDVLAGKPGPPRDIVLLGTAAALVAADRVPTFEAGLSTAATAIDDGSAAALLERWITTARAAA
jgi:anthranilate phosphoribosyltransferase